MDDLATTAISAMNATLAQTAAGYDRNIKPFVIQLSGTVRTWAFSPTRTPALAAGDDMHAQLRLVLSERALAFLPLDRGE